MSEGAKVFERIEAHVARLRQRGLTPRRVQVTKVQMAAAAIYLWANERTQATPARVARESLRAAERGEATIMGLPVKLGRYLMVTA